MFYGIHAVQRRDPDPFGTLRVRRDFLSQLVRAVANGFDFFGAHSDLSRLSALFGVHDAARDTYLYVIRARRRGFVHEFYEFVGGSSRFCKGAVAVSARYGQSVTRHYEP